jgi:surface antigen
VKYDAPLAAVDAVLSGLEVAVRRPIPWVVMATVSVAVLVSSSAWASVRSSPPPKSLESSITYEALGYRWANAVCEFGSAGGPHCVNPSNSQDLYDWGYFTGSTFHPFDPWGYEYRNCTSFVAWKLNQYAVPASDFNFASYRLGEADQWLADAQSSRWNLPTGTTPEVDSVAVSVSMDHVMFVTAVNPPGYPAGDITVQEYNQDRKGDGDSQTAAPLALGISGYIYYRTLMKNPPSVLSAPTGLSVTRLGNNDVLLKWSPPADKGGLAIKSYEIDTSPNGKDWNVAFTVLPDLPEAVLSCSPGADCWYKVAAVTDAGLGLFRSAKAKNVPPGPPTALSVTRLGNNDVLLKWSPPADKGGLAIKSYEIESSINGKDWNVESNGTILPDLPEMVLSAGTDRWYKVAAITDGGYGSFSTMTSVQNTLPGAPTFVGAPIVGDGQLLLKWSPPAQTGGLPIDSYEIETSTDGTDWNIVSNGTILPDLPEAVLSCSPGTGCQYKVAAITDAGYGPFSQVVLVHMPPKRSTPVPTTAPSNEAPSPPTGLSAKRVPEGVLLQWSPPTNTYGLPISYYEVYLSTNKGRDWTTRVPGSNIAPYLPPEPTALIDTGCAAAESCMYEIRAFTAAGSSGPSNSATVTNSVPSPPTGLSAKRVPEGVLLQWSAPANAHGLPIDSYVVYLSTNNGRDWTIRVPAPHITPDEPPEPTALIDTGCAAAESCMYEIRAFTVAGSSGPSNTATVGG